MLREAKDAARAERYLREEWGNDVSARACRFCGVHLGDSNPYDLIDEAPGETEGFFWTNGGDVDEFICGSCWTRRNSAFEAFRKLGAEYVAKYSEAFEAFRNLRAGILQ